MAKPYPTDVTMLLNYCDEQWISLLSRLEKTVLPTPRPVVRLHADYAGDEIVFVGYENEPSEEEVIHDLSIRHADADTMTFREKRPLAVDALSRGATGKEVSAWLKLHPTVVSRIKHGAR